MELYDQTNARGRIGNDDSESYQMTSGVLQGDTLTPFLFVVILDTVFIDAQLGGYTIQRRRSSRMAEILIAYLAFADDADILCNKPTLAQDAVEKLYH